MISVAHMHNGGSEYWAEPQAVASRDLTRILFATQWESTDAELSTYEIYLPEGSVPAAESW